MIMAFRTLCDSGLQGWELRMAGSAEDMNWFRYLEQVAAGYPVRFYINLSVQDMRNLYASASFYWHASGTNFPGSHVAQEHLGLTTIEAMASGAVPVVYGSGGQPEIITPGVNGVLCQNTYTMAAVTMELIDNLSRWSKLSRNAILSAESWQDEVAFLQRLQAWIDETPMPALPKPQLPERLFEPKDVCIVIPVRNGVNYTHDCIRTILKTQPDVGKIVVIDNASDDETDVLIPLVLREGVDEYVWNAIPKNYSESNNQALEHTDKPILLACNNDLIFLDDGWLGSMLDGMGDGVGIVGAKLLYPNSNLQHAGGAIDWNRPDIGHHRWYGWPDFPGANQYEMSTFVTGALMLVRRELWKWPALGGGYGYEDAALCFQAHAESWKVMYQPAARAIHYESITR